jgi:pimeloyl-ACP methyl ester carboxylesterase
LLLTYVIRGDDDYFSSDLDPEFVAKVWGRFKKPALVLPSGEDEFVPASIDVVALLESWKKVGPQIHRLSGLIPGASHNVAQPDAQNWLSDTVARFLGDISS